jgi:hypothetical protein
MNAFQYRRLFDVAQELEDTLGGGVNAAFQYLITITTPPPERLATAPWPRQYLSGVTADGLLFRQRIASARQTNLFIANGPEQNEP